LIIYVELNHGIIRSINSGNADDLSANTITSICQDKAGTLWIGTAEKGLTNYHPASNQIRHYHNQADPPDSRPDNQIAKLFVDRTGVLWIVTGNGRLTRFEPASGRFMDSHFPDLAGLKVAAVVEDNGGGLWVGTYGKGVGLLDRETGKFTPRGCDFSPDSVSGSYKVVSLYADDSGNLWIGTEGHSIDKINTNLNFTSYNNSVNPPDLRFSDEVILAVLKDSAGVVWLGTANGGIIRLEREKNRVTAYQHDPQDSGSISSNSIRSIYEDSQGTLWFGAIDGTLNRFEPTTGKFRKYRITNAEKQNPLDNGIMRMHEGKDGRLWLCTANEGLVRFDRNTGQFTQFQNDPQAPDSISSNHVLSIAEGDDNSLWVGTGEGGLNKLDLATHKFTHYRLNVLSSATQTPDYSVTAMVNDQDTLWLATDCGLFKFDKNSGTFVLVEDSQQTSPAFISGMLQDNADNLWLSTPGGLIKYNTQAAVFKKFDFEGGLQNNQYLPGAYFKSTDGEMFFGGTNGFSCFYADKIMNNNHKPPVVITGLKIFDTSAKLTDPNQISLTYKDNFISFEFAALDYANPNKNQYAYKLEGFDADWHYSGTRNYASYTNLDGGEYVLRVKAANNDGIWNEQGTQIKLAIAPPFWETAWFRLITFIFTAALIMGLIKLKTRSIKLKSIKLERQVKERTKDLAQANQQLRQVDELKSNLLSMVSHEIRTPLSVILGFTELTISRIEKIIWPHNDLKDEKTQKAINKIQRDLSIIISEGDRLSLLVNNLLNISKIESRKIDWQNDVLNIADIIEQALLITRPMVEKAGLALQVNVQADLPKIAGDKDMLTTVFVNLISNAVKFTKEGQIKVWAKNVDDGILISVEDTGTGIKEDCLPKVFDRFFKAGNVSQENNENHKGMGLGLYICQQIIEQHGGKIWVESQWGRGSVFYVALHQVGRS
jgi:signal transduction histidine kinase/ligand-binding sensor domain-containing protein